MILDILLVQYSQLQLKEMRVFGISEREKQTTKLQLNATTFSSLQCDTTHFKHAMNTTMWHSLKYPSNVY